MLTAHAQYRLDLRSPHYQVIFTSIIIFSQVLIVVVGLIVIHPDVSRNLRLNREDHNNLPEIFVSCVVDHVAILVICAIYEKQSSLLHPPYSVYMC